MRRYTTILLALLLVALVAAGCGDFETGNVTSNQGGKDSTASQTVQATTVSEGEEATVGAEPLTTTEEPQKDATGSGETTTDAQSSKKAGQIPAKNWRSLPPPLSKGLPGSRSRAAPPPPSPLRPAWAGAPVTRRTA